MFRPTLFISAVLLVLFSSLLVPMTSAQTATPPDYQIYLAEWRADGESVLLTFSVYNRGGASSQIASVEVTDRLTGQVIIHAEGVIPPLATGSIHSIALDLDITRYPSGSTQQIEIIVARPEISAGVLPIMSSNSQALSLLIPAHGGGTSPQIQQTPIGQSTPLPFSTPDVEPESNLPTFEEIRAANPDNLIVEIPLTDFYIDFGNQREFLLRLGIGLLAGAIVVLLVMLFRTLFSGPPQFGNWQPPYANMPPLDPNSMAGRRQQWQFHAQNNLLPATGRPGVIVARKLLTGMDGEYLSGWRVKALRMTQYDMYGRVSRSQVLMGKNDLKTLDKTATRLHKLPPHKITKRVRPIARRIAKQFSRKITRRSAMLAIALDARLQGGHGEVRILFELYDYANAHPVRLDAWEPDMTVLGKAIYESYTYTLFGQQGGESYRDFRKRLIRDVERALTDMLRDIRPPTSEPTSAPSPNLDASVAKPPTARDTQPVPKINPEVTFAVEDEDSLVSYNTQNHQS